METTTLLDPSKVTTTQLCKLEERYSKPRSSMEAFILRGVQAEMKSRKLEVMKLNGLLNYDPDYDDDETAHEVFKCESDEFDMILSTKA